MLTEQQLLHQHELRTALLRYHTQRTERDQLLRDAHKAGISVTEIARLAGLTRQHTSRIIHEAGA